MDHQLNLAGVAAAKWLPGHHLVAFDILVGQREVVSDIQ
jgi:hypothetical protein